MKRTDYCGRIDRKRLGQTVTVCGWVHRRRDHGGVIFIDLRDREGLVQIVCDPDAQASFAIAQIDENDAAVIATPVHPAADGDRLGQELAVDAPAVVGAFQVFLRRIIQGPKQRIRVRARGRGRAPPRVRSARRGYTVNFGQRGLP